MRILLANPPLTKGPRFPIPGIITDKGRDMPLGLLYLAASLKEAGHNNVRVQDVHTDGDSPEAAAKKILDYRPDFLGLTLYSFSCYDARLLIEKIKNQLPDCYVCLGGPHARIYPEQVLEGLSADSVCTGPGEKAIVQLVDSLDRKKTIPGILRPGEKLAPPESLEDLDTIAFPDLSAIDISKYTSWVVERPMSTAAMITSRGCPFGCIFCNQSRAPFAQRSVENVLQEVVRNRDLGISMIHFEDDCMNLRPEWMFDFCDRMAALENRPFWSFRGRVQSFDEKMARACAKAGCIRINFGIESGDDGVLESIGKNIRIAQAQKAVEAAKKVGISTVCYFIFGFPEETQEQMEVTYQKAKAMNPDFAQFSPLVLLPGTPLYEREKSIRPHGYDPYAEYSTNPSKNFLPPAPTALVSRIWIFRKVRWAYFRFYFRPQFLFSGKGAAGGFFKGLAAGFSLLRYVLFGPKNWKEGGGN